MFTGNVLHKNIQIKLPFTSCEENFMYGGIFENKLSLKAECSSELSSCFDATKINFVIYKIIINKL